MQCSRLRFLSPEIRTIIYEFVFQEDCEFRKSAKISPEIIGYTSVNDIYSLGERYECGILRMADGDDLVCCCPPAVSIIYTCKQISRESIPVLYRTTKFDCTSIGLFTSSRLEYHFITHDFIAFCSKIGRANADSLRTWMFRWPCELADSITNDWAQRILFRCLHPFQFFAAQYLPKCHFFVTLGIAVPHAELRTVYAKDAELYDLAQEDIDELHTRYLRLTRCRFDIRDLRTSFLHAAAQLVLRLARLLRTKAQKPTGVWRELIRVMARRLEQQQKDLVWCWICLEEYRRGRGRQRVRFEMTALQSEVTSFEADAAAKAKELIDAEKAEPKNEEKRLAISPTDSTEDESVNSAELSHLSS